MYTVHNLTVPLSSAMVCTPVLGNEDSSPETSNQIRIRRYGVRDPAPKVVHIYVNGPGRYITRFLCWLCLEIATLQIMSEIDLERLVFFRLLLAPKQLRSNRSS